MAGLYDQIKNGNLAGHQLDRAFKAYWLSGNAKFTATSIRDAYGIPVSSAAETDLLAIKAVFDAKNANQKAEYLTTLEYANQYAHGDPEAPDLDLSDAEWRTELEI